jgi:hypothetical protein
MARRPLRKVTYFEPVAPRLARNTVIECDVRGGSPLPLHYARRLQPARSRCGDPVGTLLDEEELADWRAGRSAVYQLAALTVGARLAVADA